MRKFSIFVIFIFLSSTQLMSQEIKLSFDSLQSSFTKSLSISKLEIADKNLTIVCSFSNKDLSHILISKKYDIYISSEKKYYRSSLVTITTLNDSVSLLAMVFQNYVDTLDKVDLFSDCETCFYFKGIRLLRSYDVLALDDGTIIKAILIEEGVNVIKYKKIGFVNDSVYSIPRDQVKCIRYRVQQEKKPDLQDHAIGIQPQTIPDIIVMLSKQEINAVILEVGLNEVKYKKFDFIDGPTFSVLKKDVNLIQYHNGQTEILNSYADYQARQNQIDSQKSPEVNTSNYGGPFSLGIVIGGGGLIGIPIRLYPSEQVAIDLTVGFRPMIGTSSSSTDIGINVFYTGGFDIFSTKFYNPKKERVQMSGFFIKGGGSSGIRYGEVFGAVGWAYEQYKWLKQSFTFQLGVGIIRLHDKDYNHFSTSQTQQIDLDEYGYKPMLFWKFGWNFF